MGKHNNYCELDKLQFEPSFFQSEVREGFYISTMMKRYWAAQLVVLSNIAQICKRHDIKWFADCGSLIGAIRHEGYIPWDDDLDICMLREDWLRFFEYARNELPKSYKILTITDEPEYKEIIGRVVNNSVIDTSIENLELNCGCPYIVGIDIFPLDGVYEDEDKEKERTIRAQKLIARFDKETREYEKRKLLRNIEKVYYECSTDNASYVALMPFFINKSSHKYPKELFRSTAKLPFESTLINVPARYEEVLNIEYRSYMQVVKNWNYHGYPVYADQEEILRDNLSRNPYRYTFSINDLLLSIKRYTLKLINPINPSDRKDKEVVVFLPCRACWWKSMEPLWRQYKDDPHKEIHVAPIFYYDSDHNGDVGDMHDEREEFPDYLDIEDCKKLDLEGIHPDKIVIQVPFDGWNSAITVHEHFYSSNLVRFTDELIYIPCFDIDPPLKLDDKAAAAIRPFIEQPAVVNADKIILKDEMMRSLYIERLTELSSEDTRNYWENKIVVLDTGSSCSEVSCRNDFEDDKWNELIKGSTGKVIVYYVTISLLARFGERAIDKIRRSLEIFEKSGDGIIAIFEPQAYLDDNLKCFDETLYKQYKDAACMIENIRNVVLDEEGAALLHMNKWDAYYGEQGAWAHKCWELGIPVMIENVDI